MSAEIGVAFGLVDKAEEAQDGLEVGPVLVQAQLHGDGHEIDGGRGHTASHQRPRNRLQGTCVRSENESIGFRVFCGEDMLYASFF